MRKVIKWNENWGFLKGEHQQEVVWEVVTLPHTWNALDGQDGGNDYYQGPAWYKKTLTLESDWKEVYIRFGAVNKKAEVWCNGKSAGQHLGGFSAFTFDLTPFLQDGENEILVKADNSNELPIYPRQADFTFFGGIYREVELICFDENAHFDVTRFGTDAVFVTPSMDGTVVVDTYVIADSSVYAEIFDTNGSSVAKSKVMELGKNHRAGETVQLTLKVPEVQRWDGTKDAYLYQVKVFLSAQNVQDVVAANFGFRDYTVSASEGFFLNGAAYPLHGVCRHQDRENMGWAVTEKEHIEDMALMREIGANTIRLAHYQQAPFFYDLCDRNGMVVWAEIPFISVYDEREEADENLRQQMQELVLQNYNHPSICFWGIANEVGIGGESEKMYKILRELNQLTRELDPSRLTVIANVGMTRTDSPLFHITDVTSYNEYKGWYEGTMDDHGAFCDERHNEIPEIPLAISEYGAESILSWHSEHPKIKDYSEEYQALVHEKAQKAFEERPNLWATWLWNMFDFAADARDEGGCKGRNNKGLVTYDRSIKKQAFYFYKACWSKEPFVYLCGKRFTKHAEDKINIKVYSNQKQVDLWVNGEHIGHLCESAIFEFKEVALSEQFNEILVRTPEGLMDTLILEKVDKVPEEYVFTEEKNVSDAVAQWFANLQSKKDDATVVREIVVREGYLSVNDPMEEIYKYPEGFQAVQELIATPMAVVQPAMAERMSTGGVLSFTSIWHHIGKLLPDEAYYLLNERLNKIKK
ncbi:glycoside hydrolase family 2 protein [Anaerobium acetethylicum]|uniref:Beta-galactosidase n=1 Tax=Anaerobium acetethylicum TaxID=1619234 RepID=A0A1D3TV82_9FIRM|nr:glycoside hydrolase family 2 TIM barrel-domain containing protein [Anaerobium acetethylicum]SCP98006.1 beta-galactosidase [Anaerobium acetethylicum]